MQNLLTLRLEAHHETLNHHRLYEIWIGHDLLGDWTMLIRYGRCGTQGSEKQYAASSSASIRLQMHEVLTRRLSAPRRIDCPYRIVHFKVAKSLDQAEWLPAKLLCRFGDGAFA